MSHEFSAFLTQTKTRVDRLLGEHLGSFSSSYAAVDSGIYLSRLQQAMHYSLVNGGKRIRPVLVYATATAITTDISPVVAANLDRIATP